MSHRIKPATHALGDINNFAPAGLAEAGPLLSPYGRGGLVTIQDEAGPYLKMLAEKFPREFDRALRHVGYECMMEVKRTIWRGGPRGDKWSPLSMMRVSRRMEQLKAAGNGSSRAQERLSLKRITKKRKKAIRAGSAKAPDHFLRWKRWQKGRSDAFSGKMASAARYKFDPKRSTVRIGFISRTAARASKAMQGALRGEKDVYQFQGRQFITPKMRKAFWAAGVPLSKDKQYLEQDERQLVAPVFREFEPKIEKIIEARIHEILNPDRVMRPY